MSGIIRDGVRKKLRSFKRGNRMLRSEGARAMGKGSESEELEPTDENEERIIHLLEDFNNIGHAGYRHGKIGFFYRNGGWVMWGHHEVDKYKIEKYDGEVKRIKIFLFEDDPKRRTEINVSDKSTGISSNIPLDIGVIGRD